MRFTLQSSWPFVVTHGPDKGFPARTEDLPTASGRAVTPDSAMRVPAVAACVRAISEACGSLPIKLYKRLPEGGKEAADTHVGYRLAHDEANEWTSAADFRTQLTQDALLWGSGFAWVNRVDGKPYELIRLEPKSVTVSHSAFGEPSYKVQRSDGVRVYGFRDIIHIRATSVDGATGVAPITSGREAVALAMVLEHHAARLFNEPRPAGILKSASKLNAEATASLIDTWRRGASGGTPVLENGVEWQSVVMTSTDAQFAELRQAQNLEICRLFRVPPIFVQDYSRMTWNNGEGSNLVFVQHCLAPWLQQWESAYRRALLTEDERRTLDFDFLLEDFLRADTATRFEAYTKAIGAKWLSPNEVRARENLPPYAGGDTYENPATSSRPANGGADAQPGNGGDQRP